MRASGSPMSDECTGGRAGSVERTLGHGLPLLLIERGFADRLEPVSLDAEVNDQSRVHGADDADLVERV